MTASPEHAAWFDDAHRLIDVTRENRGGLPLPQISGTLASFHFTQIIHAEDARKAVAWAETILSGELGLTFEPKRTPRIGSAAHWVIEAFMPSGLRVDIVAKAGIFDGQDEREDAGTLVAAA